MSCSLSVFLYSVNIVDSALKFLMIIIFGDEGRLGLVQIVQWIKGVCDVMFPMEWKAHYGDKHFLFTKLCYLHLLHYNTPFTVYLLHPCNTSHLQFHSLFLLPSLQGTLTSKCTIFYS